MNPNSGTMLDVSKVSNTLWLVKVPKYVADKWDNAPNGLEVGKIKIVNTPGKKADLTLNLSEALLASDNEKNSNPIPKSFKLDSRPTAGQVMGVLSEQRMPYDPDATYQEPDKLAMQGKITQKLECQPIGDKVIIILIFIVVRINNFI